MGSCSSVACHAAHYGLAAGTGLLGGMTQGGMAGLSIVFLGASYGVWYRFLGGHCRPVREQIGAFIVQAGISLAIFSGTQAMALHDHMSSEKAQWYESLTPEMKESLLSGSDQTYRSLPADLRNRLEEAAEAEGIPPSVYILICSGDDPLTTEINAYIASKKAGEPSLEGPR